MKRIDKTVYEAQGSVIEGDVTIGADAGIWFNAVIRGDEGSIFIGDRSNVQDNATVHSDPGYDVRIGDYVSVGHNAIVHGASIGDNTIIGMGAIVLDGAKVGKNCMIGAGALVTHGTVIPDNSVAFGTPAKVARAMTDEEIAANKANAIRYVNHARDARTGDLIEAISPSGD